MQGSTQQLENPVAAFAMEGGLLQDAARVLRVIEGSVDIFLVRVERGGAVGARRPVARVMAGGTIFSSGWIDSGFGLYAQPTPRTTIEEADRDSLLDEELTRWMAALSGSLGVMTPPAVLSPEPGQQIELPGGARVGSTSGLKWLEVVSGRLQLFGWPPLEPIGATTVIAVSPEIWLASDSDARVRCIAPSASEMEEGRNAFHRQIIAALVVRSQAEESRLAQRLANRVQTDRASYQVAQRALANVLEDKGGAVQAGTGDPLLQAVRAVGDVMGIAIAAAASRAGARDPIANIARASSIRVRKVNLKRGWWSEDGGPFVGYLAESQQPVALLPKGPSRYEMWDPVRQTRRVVDGKIAGLLTPSAHSLYRPFPAEKLNYLSLIRFGLRGLRRDAGLILMTGMLAGLLGLISPVVSGILFDSIIPATDRPQLVQVFGILLSVAFAMWLLQLLQGFALLRVESRMDAGLQAALWDRLLSLPVTFFRGFTAGDLAGRSLTISSMRQFLTGTVLSAVLGGVFSLFSLGLLFHYGGGFAIPALGLVGVSFLITVLSALLQVRIQRQLTALSGRVAGLLPQLLGGISKLRAAGAEERGFARWAVRFAEQKKLAVSSRRISIALSIVFPMFRAGTTMVLFLFLARPGDAGGSGLTTGAFLAFQAAFLQVLAGASELGSALVSALAVAPLYERAKPILEALPEVSRGKTDPGELSGDVELTHVAFRYRSDLPPVLKDVSLRIRAGQFVALVGGTGSGKSTMLRLMLGFENPESGSLFYDGQDLSTLDVQSVRRQIGVVLQQGGVMGGDLFSNIVGSSPLTINDAWEAARMAGLEEDIRNMPMGMHTVVPDGGLGLSGGQRQRLQIARAIVNRPRLIFFDEATSALDNQTQAIVTESLARLKATRIVIAHRLSTIRHADCIFALNQGVVEESGTYEELMARNGFFAELAKRQLA